MIQGKWRGRCQGEDESGKGFRRRGMAMGGEGGMAGDLGLAGTMADGLLATAAVD
jgi:hypothetical protein